jgi:cytochrome c biogenesis protein
MLQQSGDGEGNVDVKMDNMALQMRKPATKRTLSVLSNLPLAITQVFNIASHMVLGTVPYEF